MGDGSGLAEAMLGLDGVRLTDMREADREVTIEVETTERRELGVCVAGVLGGAGTISTWLLAPRAKRAKRLLRRWDCAVARAALPTQRSSRHHAAEPTSVASKASSCD